MAWRRLLGGFMKAIDVIKLRSKEEIDDMRFSEENYTDGTLLAHCKYFKVSKYDIVGGRMLYAGADSFASVLCIEGTGVIVHNGHGYTVKAGDSYFIPAGTGNYMVYGKVSVIESKIK